MKFDMNGIREGADVDKFQSDWIAFTSQENKFLLNDGRVSSSQLLVIHMYCGNIQQYEKSEFMAISSNGPAQTELEALIRARGRALAVLIQANPEVRIT